VTATRAAGKKPRVRYTVNVRITEEAKAALDAMVAQFESTQTEVAERAIMQMAEQRKRVPISKSAEYQARYRAKMMKKTPKACRRRQRAHQAAYRSRQKGAAQAASAPDVVTLPVQREG
jgi:hypothetical protein